MKKETEKIEIPFGAKDSELYKFEYTIPEGYEAVIKDGKVFVEKKESEDERIMKEIVDFIYWAIDRGSITNEQRERSDSWLAYLEKKKEQKPESCDCSRDEESYTNGIHHVLMNPEAYGLIKQKPAEWSEEDDALLKEIVSFFKDGTVKLQHDLDLYAGFLEKKFKSLRPQSIQDKFDEAMHVADKFEEGYKAGVYDTKAKSWKPSEEDENHFKHILNVLEDVQDEQMEKGFNNLISDICWFESLRLRINPHWKPSEEQRHIEGQDTCYLNKQKLVNFIEDCIAENLENTTDANHDNHEGYHQACLDIIYRINQMCK